MNNNIERSSQSRDTPRLKQETQTTLSEEAVAKLPSYSFVNDPEKTETR